MRSWVRSTIYSVAAALGTALAIALLSHLDLTITLWGVTFRTSYLAPRLHVAFIGPFPFVYGRAFYADITLSLIAGLIPLALHAEARYRETMRLIEEAYKFMHLASAYLRARTLAVDMLSAVADSIEEPLRSMIMSFRTLLLTGMEPQRAFMKVFGRSPASVRRILRVIPIAMSSGGRSSEVLDFAVGYVRELRQYVRERRATLSAYIVVILIASITFSLTSLVVLVLAESIQETGGGIIVQRIDTEYMFAMYYISAQVISVFSGLMIGRVIKEYTPASLKYIAALMGVTALIFFVVAPLLGV